MAILEADAQGNISGTFTIPEGVTSGTKEVAFTGSGGSRGVTKFEGSNTLTNETRRRVRRRPSPPPPPPPPAGDPSEWYMGVIGGIRIDPLAQTFTLSRARLISGVDLWFEALGTSDIIVQIRGVSAGVPSQDVVASTRSSPSDLSTSGHSRILFSSPVRLEGGVEYAIVVLCDDADAALAVAELGKWDAANQQWVTSQPYQVGVLLSSSNASTWTAHQEKDMAFRLLAAEFTATERTIDLGNVPVSNASDLMVLADVERLASDSDVVFRLTMLDAGDAPSMIVPAWQQVELATRYTGDVKIEALFFGTQDVTALLFPDVQLAVGDMDEIAEYVSRVFETGGGDFVRVTLESQTPGNSAVTVEIDDDGSWVAMTQDTTRQVGDGWVEVTYTLDSFTPTTSRIRITLEGTASARPRVAELRVMFT